MALKYPASLRRLGVLPKRNETPLLCSRRSLHFESPTPRNIPAIIRPTTAATTTRRAMDLFPDGGFVRLESRGVPGKFVHAEEDWEKVTLRPNGVVPALNTVWRVQHLVAQGYTYVLLQNAAYGRYLSYSMKKVKGGGHRGFRAAQRNRSEPDGYFATRQSYPWMWRVQSLPAPDQAYVSLRYFTCYLCANTRVFRWMKNFVTADVEPAAPRLDRLMHWTVHTVEASPLPRPLPIMPDDEGDDNALLYPRPPRTIRHVRANNQGEFDQNHYNWDSFAYFGTSVIFLKNQLRLIQGWNEDVANFTLCIRPGSHGRLLPLVTNDQLPHSLDSMNIVAFRTGTPGAAALRYPAPPATDDDAA